MMSKIMGRTIQHAVDYLQRKIPEYSVYAEIKELIHSLSNQTQTKSKEKEILQNFVKTLNQRFSSGDTGMDEKRFCIMTLLFVSNYDVKTNQLHHFVIQFIEQSKNIADKKLGYVAITVLFEKDGSCLYLIVNTLLKDINCAVPDIISSALTTLSNILIVDLIPVFLPSMEKRIKHSDANIRQKVLTVYHKMFLVGPEFIRNQMSQIIDQSLRDKNPCVLSSTLQLTKTTVKAGIELNKIGRKLVFILAQVEAGYLPLELMYRGVSGAWIQLCILDILKQLSDKLDDDTRNKLSDVVSKIFNRIQVLSGRIHIAIFVECVSVVVVSQPFLKSKLEYCSECITTLILSGQANLIHTGLLCLIKISEVDEKFAAEHKEKIMNCLRSKDESIRKMALLMVKTLTNETNVKAICTHLFTQISEEKSSFKSYLLGIVLKIVKKYPSDDYWMMERLHDVIKTIEFGNVDCEIILQELMNCMRKAVDEIKDKEIAWCLSELKQITSTLQLEYICWVVTEYAGRLSEEDLERTICLLFRVHEVFQTEDSDQKDLVWLLMLNTLRDMLLHSKKLTLFEEHMEGLKDAMPASHAVLNSYFELSTLLENEEIVSQLNIKVEPNETFKCDFSFLDEFVEKEKSKHPLQFEEDVAQAGEPSVVKKTNLKFLSYHESDIASQQTKTFIPTGKKIENNNMATSFLSSVASAKSPIGFESKWNIDGYLPTKQKAETSSVASNSSQNLERNSIEDSFGQNGDDAIFSDVLFSHVSSLKPAESSITQQNGAHSKTLDLNQALENLTNLSISPVTEDFA